MNLPEYYLTACELEIFPRIKLKISSAHLQMESNSFDLIELGAGDGTNTAVLVDHFLKRKAEISYAPIDISRRSSRRSHQQIQD